MRQRAGIGRYTRNLVRAATQLGLDHQFRLLVAGGWGAGDGLGPWPASVRICSLPLSDRLVNIAWQRLQLPIPVQLVTGSLDLFHSPDFVLPPTARAPAIVTVHDLSFLRVPECFVPAFHRYLTAAVTRAVKRASAILADSESTRRDLIELLGVETERVTVIYPGVEPRFEPIMRNEELERVRQQYELPPRFILGLGTLQPRKNFLGLINAFASLLGDAGDEPELRDLHLVIAGGTGWMSADLAQELLRLGVSERVHFIGYVLDEHLPALYSLARLFAFPSWYEGFGLPVLEAMACGTPVITADNSSLPEVAGAAALMVNASDSAALTSAIRRLLLDPALQRDMSGRGIGQAHRFRWDDAARQLLALYAGILDRKSPRHNGRSFA